VQGMKAHSENSREVGAWHSSPPEGRGILPTSRSIREAKSNAKPPSSIHGMRELFANRRIPIHENSRTTALEIFGKSSRTLRAIFQLARFNRYQAKTGFPNEPHADVRLANIAHHSLPEAANPCTLRFALGSEHQRSSKQQFARTMR